MVYKPATCDVELKPTESQDISIELSVGWTYLLAVHTHMQAKVICNFKWVMGSPMGSYCKKPPKFKLLLAERWDTACPNSLVYSLWVAGVPH